MIALIDGDILVYRGGFGAQHTLYTAENMYTGDVIEFDRHVSRTAASKQMTAAGLDPEEFEFTSQTAIDPPAHACQNAKMILDQIKNALHTQQVVIVLTSCDRSNYRFALAKRQPYKGNRIAPKPFHYDTIRKYLIETHEAVVVEGREADDVLGVLQCRHNKRGQSSVICSIDKDMDMIPGQHFNFVKNILYETSDPGELILETLENNRKKLTGGGLKWFYAQCLLGDNADNIPGIPQYGQVTVYNLLRDLNTEKQLYTEVLNVYNEHYEDKGEEYLNESASLLWIQREDNVLWKPPK